MILKKAVIDGKEVFVPITLEEAYKVENKDDLVFTDEDEKEEFEDSLEELSDKFEDLEDMLDDLYDDLDEKDESSKNEFLSVLDSIKTTLETLKKEIPSEDLEAKLDSLEDQLSNLEDEIDELEGIDDNDDEPKVSISNEGENVKFNGKDFGEAFGNAFEKMGKAFGNMFSGKPKSKSDKIVTMLPFMAKEDLHEVVEEILNNSEDYKDLDLVTVFPFLGSDDCDKLFMRFVIENNQANKKYIHLMGPFVSQACLSKLVDEYVEGKYQDINMDALYPFMDSKDVKRVFKYMIKNK